MTKQDSLELKGIAILMMLFLHLFNTEERVGECITFLQIAGKPFVYLLSRLCGICVPIYIFITGYGLAASWYKDSTHSLHPFRRLMRLYGAFWTVFLVFIPLACFISPQEYPNSIIDLLMNAACLTYTYNNEWWFLRPYIILLLLSPLIISFMMRGKKECNLMLGLSALSYGVWWLLCKTGWLFGFYPIEVIKNVFQIFLPFVYGIWVYKMDAVNKLHSWLLGMKRSKAITMKVLGLLLPIALCFVVKGVYMKALVFLPLLPFYLLTKRSDAFKRFVCFFGYHSTYMWLTHTFFCYYLFHSYIYGLKYPLLMYIVLVVVSLLSSYVCQWLHQLLSIAIDFVKSGVFRLNRK